MPDKSRSDTNGYVWSRSVPDPGQLVEIRRRQWVVGDVEASAFSSTGNGSRTAGTDGVPVRTYGERKWMFQLSDSYTGRIDEEV